MSGTAHTGDLEHPERVFVISGPSGVGKNSVARGLCEGGAAVRAVTATTRAPRPGERDGVDYHFVSEQEFERWWREGRLVERNCYAGRHYGTPASAVNRAAESGLPVLLVIDVNGAMEVRRRWPRVRLVFLRPPSEEALLERLRGRGAEDEQAIEGRMEQARREMAMAGRYDHVVVNDRLEDAVRDISRLITRKDS